MRLRYKRYRVFVIDPRYPDRSAGFTIPAASEEHAIQQAKDGYTGLLGNYEEVQERLKVRVYPL